MVGGSIFVLIFIVWMPMGFFHPKPLDDLTINLNLNESPKGDEHDEAHDYGNAGNKPGVQKHYSHREFAKKINESIFDSAKNLTKLMKFAAEDLVPPEVQNYMDNLNQEIGMISNNIVEWISNDEKILINRISTKMVKSHNDLYFLRQTLIILAKETIRRSNRIIKLFKKIKQDDSEYNMKVFQSSTKKMKRLLKRSYGILEDAIKKFMKIAENVELVKEDMRNLINTIGKMDDEEKAALDSWIDTKRLEVYGGSAACIATGPLAPVGCTITYATATAILEPIIKAEKAKFAQLAVDAKEAENNAQHLFTKIKEKAEHVRIESQLITEWKSHISLVQDDLTEVTPEYIEDFLYLDEDKEAIENLCKLTKACKDYIEHSPPGVEIVSPPLHAACSAAGTP